MAGSVLQWSGDWSDGLGRRRGRTGCRLPRGLQGETGIGRKKEEAGREQEVRIGPVLPADG
jgi:hypothetical protein